MSLREELLEYMNELPVPEEFSPEKMGERLFPESFRGRKKKAPLLSVPEPADKKPEESAASLLSIPEGEKAEPAPEEKKQPVTAVLSMPSAPKKTEKAPEISSPLRLEREKPVQKSEPLKINEEKKPFVLNAYSFMKIVQSQKLTGKEFLQLIGNSRISNKAYLEIEQNPGLTQKRLVEILEESGLTEEDYEKLLIAINKRSKLKQASLEQLKQREKKQEEQKRLTGLDAQKLIMLAEKKKQEQPAPSEDKAAKTDIADDAEEEKSDELTDAPENEEESPEQTAAADLYDRENDDDSDDEEDEYNEDEGYVNGMNSTKIGIVFALAVLLLIISFGLRYYYTGSFFVAAEEQSVPDVIETNEQLFLKMSSMQKGGKAAFPENKLYSVGGTVRDGSEPLPTACNGDYLFICSGNDLYIVGIIGGQMKQLDKIAYSEAPLGVVLSDGDFYVISEEKGVSTPFNYTETVTKTDENGEEIAETVELSDVLLKDYLVIERFDGKNTDDRTVYRQSGALAELLFIDGKICAFTYENMAENAVESVYETYLPHFTLDGQRTYVGIEDVFFPENAQYSSFLNIGVLDAELSDCGLSVIAGGSEQVIFSETDGLYIAQSDNNGTLLFRYNISGEKAVLDKSGRFDGKVGAYSGLDSSEGIIRFTTLQEDGGVQSMTLSIADGDFKLLSQAKGVGSGETPAATCFDGRNAYIVTEQDGERRLYGVNTVDSSNLSLPGEVSANVTARQCHRWDDSFSVSLGVMSDESGLRTGLALNTIRADGSTAGTLTLQAESTVEGDWNKYLSSPAEENIGLIRGNAENGWFVVPISYFDGVSQVEKLLCFTVDENGAIYEKGGIVEYDLRSRQLMAETGGKFYFCIFDKLILSVDSSKNAIVAKLELA